MIEVGPLQISEITLARDLHQWGQHKVAEALFQQAAPHAEQVLGPDDPALASILDAYSDFLVTCCGKQRQIPSENAQIRSGGEPGRPRSELPAWPEQILKTVKQLACGPCDQRVDSRWWF